MLEALDLRLRSSQAKCFQLPPLILHPFSTSAENSLLLESSRASSALEATPATDKAPDGGLEAQLLRGRYTELRMLFYIGKDISRWAEQCVETATSAPQYAGDRILPETFAVLLVQHVPQQVRSKLESWGVLDFCALFRRAFGLHAVFGDLPPLEFLSQEFLKRYHRYLDQWYEQRLRDWVFDRPEPGEFTFDLYASGEYSSMLEKSWTENPAPQS